MDSEKHITPNYFQTLLSGTFTIRLRNTLGLHKFNALLEKYGINLEYLESEDVWGENGNLLNLPNGDVLQFKYDYDSGTSVSINGEAVSI